MNQHRPHKKNIFLESLCLGAGLWFFFLATSLWAKPRVAIDAAHGGSEPGAKSGNVVEKEWNQKVAQSIATAIEAAGMDAVLIRKKDETITQEKRDELINTAQVSLVLVIHADREWTGVLKGPFLVVEPPNKNEAPAASDIQKWGVVSPGEYRQSLKLARSIAAKLGIGSELSSLSDSRGGYGESPAEDGRIFCLPHQSLRNLLPPSVVLTPMFLTSASDRKDFSDSGFLDSFAAKVAEGVRDFIMPASAVTAPASAETPVTPVAPEPTATPN